MEIFHLETCIYCKDLKVVGKNRKFICDRKECKYDQKKRVNYKSFWEVAEDIGVIVKK